MSVLCLVCHSAVPLPSCCVQVVRNVLMVDYLMSRYKTVVEELQREITELKTQLPQQRPLRANLTRQRLLGVWGLAVGMTTL